MCCEGKRAPPMAAIVGTMSVAESSASETCAYHMTTISVIQYHILYVKKNILVLVDVFFFCY